MLDKARFLEVAKNLKQNHSCLILLPQNPNIDKVAAGLGLFLSLKQSGLKVKISCATQLSVTFNRLFAVNKISHQIGSKNLIISFPYVKDSVEKVSYNVEKETFNLVISPKEGYQIFDPKQVSYSFSGVDAKVLVIVGADNSEKLADIFAEEQEAFQKAVKIVINNTIGNNQFGDHQLFDSQVSCCSELTAWLIRYGRLSISQDAATNLIAGIESQTNSLQNASLSSTFSVMSWLLKQNGQRGHLETKTNTSLVSPFPNVAESKTDKTLQPSDGLTASKQAPPIAKESEATDNALKQPLKTETQGEVKPSPDWLLPKVFKGGNKV